MEEFKKYQNVVYDLKEFPEKDKERLLLKPIYNLFKKLFKGHLYDNTDFCYKKLKFNSPDIEDIKILLTYDENNDLIGASTLKVFLLDYKDTKIRSIQVTNGFMIRGSRIWQAAQYKFMNEIIQKAPSINYYFYDLLVSPSSYQTLMDWNITYPRYDAETPEDIYELHKFLIKKTTSHKYEEGEDSFIQKGALFKEDPIDLYTRLTRGKYTENEHIKYFYKRTKGILGMGIMTIVDSRRYLNKEKLRNFSERRMRSVRVIPKDPNTDFGFLIELRENLEMYKGKTRRYILPKFINVMIKNDSTISFNYRNHNIIQLLSPKIPFNELTCAIEAKIIESIMHGDIDVLDKYIVNIGSGSGSIGLVSILMGATKILFSDTWEENILNIRTHHLIVPEEHEFVVQNLLEISAEKIDLYKYDLVIASVPFILIDEVNKKINLQEPDEKYLTRFLSQSRKILKDNGEIIMFTYFRNFNPSSLDSFAQIFFKNFGETEVNFIALSPLTEFKFLSEDVAHQDFLAFLSIKKVKNSKKTLDYFYSAYLNLHSENYKELAQQFLKASLEKVKHTQLSKF